MWPMRGMLEAHIEYLKFCNFFFLNIFELFSKPDQRMIGDGIASSAVHRLTVHYFNWAVLIVKLNFSRKK